MAQLSKRWHTIAMDETLWQLLVRRDWATEREPRLALPPQVSSRMQIHQVPATFTVPI